MATAYEIQVVVTLQADMDQRRSKSAVLKAAVQAVENAVRLCEENGFSHDLAFDVSFGVVAVEPVSDMV